MLRFPKEWSKNRIGSKKFAEGPGLPAAPHRRDANEPARIVEVPSETSAKQATEIFLVK